jgi:tRNA wybutosine-synthesizing protein 3
LSASLEHSQRVLTAALNSGFRESGAVSLNTAKGGGINPIVAVRSTGYSFDAIIGYQNDTGNNIALFNERYLHSLIRIANERFNINNDRIKRFRSSLLEYYSPNTDALTPVWEDKEARRRRKREEGLARQQELKAKTDVASAD